MPQVQVIKATKNHRAILENRTRKLRVAAYARVSTEKDEQENSYETQIQYFTHLIKSNPDYTFVQMYADEGLTGTMRKNRVAFNQMIEDAMNGKIDIIYVKSVSRFARNTVDLLCICRDLKSKNVNVIFEKENIELLSTSGELMLTIFASMAQEESRSISENIKWTIQKNYAKGIYHMPFSSFLGYEKGSDGKPKVVKKEAEIVKRIYKLYLYGLSCSAIANQLTSEGIPTPKGNEVWSQSTIRSILTNEKYCGDARLQKQFTANFLDHKVIRNEGQVPSYYVTDDHEGIVSHAVFDMVQEMMKSTNKERRNCGDIYSRKLYCSCGSSFGRKVHHSNSKYRCFIYRCNQEYTNRETVHSARLKEEQIVNSFIQAVNRLIDKDTLIEDIMEAAELFRDNTYYETQITLLVDKRRLIEKETKSLVEKSAKSSEVEAFRERYDALIDEYDDVTDRLNRLRNKLDERKAKYQGIMKYAEQLNALTEPVEKYDEDLWYTLLERAVAKEDSITYCFKDGTEIDIKLY